MLTVRRDFLQRRWVVGGVGGGGCFISLYRRSTYRRCCRLKSCERGGLSNCRTRKVESLNFFEKKKMRRREKDSPGVVKTVETTYLRLGLVRWLVMNLTAPPPALLPIIALSMRMSP